jgi:uncharacterized protein
MPTALSAKISGLYRYPVKGLSPEEMPSVTLSPGQTVPSDRRYAIENGPIGFDPTDPKYYPKIRFLMLMRHERLARLRTHFEDTTTTLTIRYNGTEVARGDLETESGRKSVENFFSKEFAKELTGPPKILTAPGHSFSDVAKKVVSIINLASVFEIENAVGQPVDPLRFRGNIHLDGWPAWHEFNLLGKILAIGDVKLKLVKRIVRCAATNVDPVTAERDLNIPKTLMETFDHADCGVYAEVLIGGTIAAGDVIESFEPKLL